jgi:hypothetical protein
MSEIGFKCKYVKTEYLNTGSDIQNIKVEDNIVTKGTMAFKYLESIFTNSRKCKEEVLNRRGKAGKATRTLLLSKPISLNKRNEYVTELWVAFYGTVVKSGQWIAN